MSDSPALPKSCPKCGAELPSEATEGLCPRCLMAEAMQPTGPKTPAGPWQPPTAEELQKLLPQYEITALLGRGGMGAVYKGTQKSLDRPVAIKILSNDLEAADASFAERFKNEAHSMAKLSHPGIVAVHDFGETPDHLLYIVMEFIEGTDVSRMIAKQGRLHTEHAMAITAHVCDALAYAHERGIIHRDIKPANIMVGYDGVVKVADFGLAKMNSKAGESVGLTQSGMAMGTLHYMAPEALMLGAGVDHRADIYAVGVMLYQMLTGKVPHGMFELPSMQVAGLDPRYDGIIAKAMREDRDIRYQSATEMRYDLDHILTQPVVRVEPEATQAPAALPPEARPQRTVAQPFRAPPPQDVVYEKKKSSLLVWLIVLVLGAGVAWMYWEWTKTKSAVGPSVVDAAKLPSEEPWIRILDTPESFTSTGIMEIKDGWVMKKPDMTKTSTQASGERVTDGAIRAEFSGTGCALLLRNDSTKGTRYQLERTDSTLQIGFLKGLGKEQELSILKSVPMPPPGREESYLLEFRIQAGWITAKHNGNEVMRLPDNNERTMGRVGIWLLNPDSKARNIERLNLEVPDAVTSSAKSGLPVAVPSSSPPATATKEAPFINSLGMQFVPVPGTNVLFCIHETRKADYAKFAAAAPGTPDMWKTVAFANGLTVSETDNHPVVNVSWEDATAFCKWLTKKEGMNYRLPKDREWSAAVGIGDKEKTDATPVELSGALPGAFPWGNQWPPPQETGNFADSALAKIPGFNIIIQGYNDGYAGPSPVMIFKPNNLGIHDLDGNIREWCEDWYDSKQRDKITRGAAWLTGVKSECFSSHRSHNILGFHRHGTGFRCVIELTSLQTKETKAAVVPPSPSPPQPSNAASTPAPASSAPTNTTVTALPANGWRSLITDGSAFKTAKEVSPLADRWWQVKHSFLPLVEARHASIRMHARLGAGGTLSLKCRWDGSTTTEVHGFSATLNPLNFDAAKGAKVKLETGLITKVKDTVEGATPSGGLPINRGATVDMVPGQEYDLEVRCFGDQFQVLVDGKLQMTAQRDAGAGTWIALGSFRGGDLKTLEWMPLDSTGKPLTTAPPSGAPTWTDTKGRSLVATFKGIQGDNVMLEVAGKVTPVTLNTLSEASQKQARYYQLQVKPAPLQNTSNASLTNTLGMKFVPVAGTNVIFCIHETRKKDYAAFAMANPDVADTWKNVTTTPEGIEVSDGDDHPVSNVSWDEAKAFCAWLKKVDGRSYRLPTDREWSFAVHMGKFEKEDRSPKQLNGMISNAYPWGGKYPVTRPSGNYADLSLNSKMPARIFIDGYTDGFVTTAPVMSFPPDNTIPGGFKPPPQDQLYDLGGNVEEWCEDWFDETNSQRVLRGGSWADCQRKLLKTYRNHKEPDQRTPTFGFRVVIEVSAP